MLTLKEKSIFIQIMCVSKQLPHVKYQIAKNTDIPIEVHRNRKVSD